MSEWMECMWCNNTELNCIILRIPSPYRGVDLICEHCAKPEPKKKKVVIDNTFIPYKEAVKTAYEAFNSRGYNYACEVTQSLYSDDKISLIQKSKIVNELCFMESLTVKQRKLIANNA